ncbi:MAG: LPXTG cell wall anchor domain-containing protein, partial [Lachnospiraceae bacterium]|nr:LPXTG cell wall anchor domain-containing protein [Lachnospiraceae bacterium]
CAAALAAVMGISMASSAGNDAFAASSARTDNTTAADNDLENADIIDEAKTGSLTIRKYDTTAATAAGIGTGGFTSNGEQNEDAEGELAQYAMEGVQFSYLKVGEIETYTADGTIYVVYEIPEKLAEILELPEDSATDMEVTAAGCDNTGVLHFTSTQINDALEELLMADDVQAKNALEEYLYDYGTQDSTIDQGTYIQNNVKAVNMPKTDADGLTNVSGLELGLYLVVETEVPEQVTETVNPWFASLPFTDSDGEEWLYDMYCYPKNQSGNPTLDKSVRNAYSNTGTFDKNGDIVSGEEYESGKTSKSLVVYNQDDSEYAAGDKDDSTYVANRGGYTGDGVTAGAGAVQEISADYTYADTATASEGDLLDYILVSRIPHISSKATYLSEYTFTDTLGAGLTYNDDVKIAFYHTAADANANNTAAADLIWNLSDGTYASRFAEVTVYDAAFNTYTGDGSTQLVVSMTEAGLNVINGTENAITEEGAESNLDGLSDYYMVVYYTVTVNTDDSAILGDEGNPNNVTLVWSRTSNGYYNMLEDKNYVYSYGIDLTKEFSDSKGDPTAVMFNLYNNTDGYYVAVEPAVDSAGDIIAGKYYVTGKTVSQDDSSESTTVFAPASDGTLVIEGLEADSYSLTELRTDQGYTLLRDPVTIVITSTDRDIIASVAGVAGLTADVAEEIIRNYHGGIYDENGNLIDSPAEATANGRMIGGTDIYVGDILPATATVDGIAAKMADRDLSEELLTTDSESSANASVIVSITNHKSFRLPQTGGSGLYAITILGIILAVLGIMISRKEKKC